MVFTNRRVDTDLTVLCLRGKEDITTDIPPERFKWTRLSSDVENDKKWNNQDIRGKFITISERANLVIKNMSNKLASLEVTNANLLAELEIANNYINYMETELQNTKLQ